MLNWLSKLSWQIGFDYASLVLWGEPKFPQPTDI